MNVPLIMKVIRFIIDICDNNDGRHLTYELLTVTIMKLLWQKEEKNLVNIINKYYICANSYKNLISDILR